MRFVTAIDKNYFPAIKALANSFKENAGDHELTCIVYGSDNLAERVQKLGIDVLHNVDIPAKLPTSEFWPEELPAMYARIMVPVLFDSPCAWIDADCLVLQPLDDLEHVKFKHPVAAVMTSTKLLGQQVGNLDISQTISALFAGLLVFNTQRWNELEITQKCLDVMNNRPDLEFHYAVQSVLSYVLRGDFHQLGYVWQEFANRGPLSEHCKIVHYVGGCPWKDEMKNLDIWKRYA